MIPTNTKTKQHRKKGKIKTQLQPNDCYQTFGFTGHMLPGCVVLICCFVQNNCRE